MGFCPPRTRPDRTCFCHIYCCMSSRASICCAMFSEGKIPFPPLIRGSCWISRWHFSAHAKARYCPHETLVHYRWSKYHSYGKLEANSMPTSNPKPRQLKLWKVLFAFTIIVTLGVFFILLTFPNVGGSTIPDSLVFIFFPLFVFLDGVRLFQMQDYGMGGMAAIVTVPAGMLWVLCVTSLLLFGPGKWNAINSPIYGFFRITIMFLGTLYLVGSFVIFLFSFS